uniref:Galactosyltransferase N-terminal domain-containing protein n=1 Tax=Meloidogyne floridensis TaxID=298350 RepID=A0A915NIN1_9BILA
MSINSTSTINLKNKATLIKGLIIITTALIAAYILNDIINGVELRKIAKLNLIKIKSKIEEEIPQKMGNEVKNEGKSEGEEKKVETKNEEKDKIEVKNEVRNEESSEKIKIENNQDKTESTTITPPKNIILNQLTKTKNNNDDTQIIQIAKLWRVKQDNLTLCPEKPPNLKGKIDVDMRSLKLEEIEEEYKDLWPGGHWRPKEC